VESVRRAVEEADPVPVEPTNESDRLDPVLDEVVRMRFQDELDAFALKDRQQLVQRLQELRLGLLSSLRAAVELAVDLGVDVINTEFNGRPEAAETAEAQFLKSMDELLPIFEREGLQLILEPHPDDFIEDGLDAVNLVRGLNRDWIGFLYCTPHAFHQGHDAATIISAAAEKVRYVHLADAWDHTASNGLRYITNPPGNPIRVHQHMEMGMGEVDYDAVFASLAEVDFDGVISSCVFGFEEDARGVSERQRDQAVALVNKHFGERAGASLARKTLSTQAGV